MSKAERRKRQRARARERQQGMRALEEKVVEAVASGELSPDEVAAAPSLEFSGGRFEPASEMATVTVDTDSSYPYITGPVVPPEPAPSAPAILGHLGARAPEPAPAPKRSRLDLAAAPVEPVEEEEDEYEDDADADAEDDDDEEEGDEDEDEDADEEGEDGEEGEEGEKVLDALFNLACASVEQGDKLDWPEVISWLCSAEIDDPRLAFVLSLVAAKEPAKGQSSVTLDVTGDKVLEVLGEIELGELVTEARETVARQVKEAAELEAAQKPQSSKALREKAKDKTGGEPSAAQQLGLSPRKASEVADRSEAKKSGVKVIREEQEV